MIRSWTAVPPIALLSQRETTVPPSNFNSEWGIACGGKLRIKETSVQQPVDSDVRGEWQCLGLGSGPLPLTRYLTQRGAARRLPRGS